MTAPHARLRRSLALDIVVAWQIFALTKMGRKTPKSPARAIFTEPECQALYAFVHKTRRVPDQPPTLGQVPVLAGSSEGKAMGIPAPPCSGVE